MIIISPITAKRTKLFFTAVFLSASFPIRKTLLEFRRFFIFFLFVSNCLLPVFSIAQSPDYFWAKNPAGSNADFGQSVSADVNGNVFVTGYFQSTSITFGSTTPLTNGGNSDVYVVKYDTVGTALWAKGAGGSGNDVGWGIGADTNGNVLITPFCCVRVCTPLMKQISTNSVASFHDT